MPTAYHVELDAESWGDLEGDNERILSDHDSDTPHPPLDFVAALRWHRGTARRRPNFYWYHSLYHWVCDERALAVLTATVPDDIHVVGQATVDGEPASVVQVVRRLEGVVDRAASLSTPSGDLQWPTFRYSAADTIAGHVFGIPELYSPVFMGERVKAALEANGLTGLVFSPVDWSNDLPWSPADPGRDDWHEASILAASTSPWPRDIPEPLRFLAILLTIDAAMRARGLLGTLSSVDLELIAAAPAAAGFFGLTDLAGVLRELPRWTKATVEELEERYRAAVAGDALRRAVER